MAGDPVCFANAVPLSVRRRLICAARVCRASSAQCCQTMERKSRLREPKASRRTFLTACGSAAVTAALLGVATPSAHAVNGLQIFPLHEGLSNEYFFMRAGESVSYARGEVRTNPVEKTNIQLHGLTQRGVDQALLAADVLRQAGVGPTAWLWASQQQTCQETADLLAYGLGIRQERVVPEFAFLDARGVGALEGRDTHAVGEELRSLDSKGEDLRMDVGTDGTPNDSVMDVFVRVRQLLSKLETQYVGDTIVVVAPDSDTLSVLQCALYNEPLSAHHNHAFSPGELRKISPVVVDRGF